MQSQRHAFLGFAVASLLIAKPWHCQAGPCFATAMTSVAMQCLRKSRRRFSMPLPRDAWTCFTIAILSVSLPRRSIPALCTDKPLLRGASLCQAIALPSLASPCLCFALRSFASPCRSFAARCYTWLCFAEAKLGHAIPPHCNAALSLLCRCNARPCNSAAEVRVALLSHRIAMLGIAGAKGRRALPCRGTAMRWTAMPPRHWPERQRARVGAEI